MENVKIKNGDKMFIMVFEKIWHIPENLEHQIHIEECAMCVNLKLHTQEALE